LGKNMVKYSKNISLHNAKAVDVVNKASQVCEIFGHWF
jgi:hypothetical protein